MFDLFVHESHPKKWFGCIISLDDVMMLLPETGSVSWYHLLVLKLSLWFGFHCNLC